MGFLFFPMHVEYGAPLGGPSGRRSSAKIALHQYICFNTHNYIYPFQNLSLGFILKIFLKFCKCQPRYSYKIYSYKAKRVYWAMIRRYRDSKSLPEGNMFQVLTNIIPTLLIIYHSRRCLIKSSRKHYQN